MHGLIFVELKKFVDARLGEDAWSSITTAAELPGKVYLPVQEYPDDDLNELIAEILDRTGFAADIFLQQLGEFMAPDLLRMYGSLLDREWKTLDIVQHVDSTVHRVMRARNPNAASLGMKVERVEPDELLVRYRSGRRMCGLAKGIVRGMARHFRERVLIQEPECMHEGAPQCVLRIRRRT